MGSQDTNMRLTGLCLVVLSFSFIEAQTSPPSTPPTTPPEGCCLKKVVSGTSNDMDGTYNYKKNFDGEKDENCFDGCIYTREGREGEEYCFKFVNSGAANINDECGAPTGTTPPSGSSPGAGSTPLPSGSESPAPTGESSPPPTGGESSPPPTGESSPPPTGGETSPAPTGESSPPPTSPGSTVPTSAGSTLSPEDTIAAANSVITEANAAHAAATENANTASDASTAVDEIQASLSARIKRQAASTTVGPVSDCADFSSKYNQLLNELSNFSDSNVGVIKQLVTVLKNVVTNPCSLTEKLALKTETEAKVAAAKSKATEYKAAKEAEKEELVKKVQQAQANIAQANTDLANANKPTQAMITPAFHVPTIPITTAGPTSPGPTGETSPGSTGPTSPGPSSSPGSNPESTPSMTTNTPI